MPKTIDQIWSIFNLLKSHIHITNEVCDSYSLTIKCKAVDVQWFDRLDNKLDSNILSRVSYEWSGSDLDSRKRTYTFHFNTNEEIMNKFVVNKDVKIPGTNIIVEKGDSISSINYKKVNEFNQVPAIAKVVSSAVNSRITSVVRKDSIFNTCVAMGLPTKINAMKNVVCSVKDMQEAAAVLQTIYEQFGVKGSFMITWEGNGKVYFDPRTPVDTKMQIAYAKTHNLALPSTDPKKYIGY